jgi:mannose-1-phosphate guanylyltransferase
MFIFQGQVVLEELKTHANNILQPLSDRGIAAYEDLEKKY